MKASPRRWLLVLCAALSACDDRIADVDQTDRFTHNSNGLYHAEQSAPQTEIALIEEAFRVLDHARIDPIHFPILLVGWDADAPRCWMIEEGTPDVRAVAGCRVDPGLPGSGPYGFVQPFWRSDGVAVLPLLSVSGKSAGEFVLDIFHEAAHAEQAARGWAFSAPEGDEGSCLLRIQEGEARAREFELAASGAGLPVWQQRAQPPIDYAALVDNLHHDLDRHLAQLREGDTVHAAYAEGAQAWRQSGFRAADWAEKSRRYCAEEAD